MSGKQKRLIFLISISTIVGLISFFMTSPDGIRLGGARPFLSPTSAISKPIDVTRIPPTGIFIEKLDKTLPISAALVHDNEWELFDDKVSWLSSSSVPGEGGNVILYAHNTNQMLGDLYLLQPGDTIKVLQGESWISYVVVESRKVDPTDVHSVTVEDDLLTIYTCEGSFNQKRRVVYAVPL